MSDHVAQPAPPPPVEPAVTMATAVATASAVEAVAVQAEAVEAVEGVPAPPMGDANMGVMPGGDPNLGDPILGPNGKPYVPRKHVPQGVPGLWLRGKVFWYKIRCDDPPPPLRIRLPAQLLHSSLGPSPRTLVGWMDDHC